MGKAKSELLRFPVSLFRQTLDLDKPFRDAWQFHLAREVRRLRTQCERMNLRGACQRVLHFIETEGIEGRIHLSHSRKNWADELGLTHEALYRTLRTLQSQGVLSINGKEIVLVR